MDEIRDDENVVIIVLNNPNLTVGRKRFYISILQTTISFINEITDNSLWIPLLDSDIVKYSEHNIMECFKVLKLNENVVSYINKCNIDLDFSKYEFDDTIKEELFDNIIICDSIENSKYEQILVSLNFYYNIFNIANISDDKVVILINTNIIRMTEENMNFIRENYSDKKLYFIKKNIEKYVSIMSKTLFSQEELLEILIWDISDELKIKLLEFSNESISIIGKSYSENVCKYILDNNFMNSDLIKLFLSYDQWEDSIQEKIFDYAVSNITSIINNPENASGKLKDKLICTEKLNRETKIDLLISMMPTLSNDYIKEILSLFDLNNYNKIFDINSRPRFEISNESEKLLTAFKNKGLIYNFEKIIDKEYYKIVRIKSRNPSNK